MAGGSTGLRASCGILGKLEPGELQRRDKDGITREQALLDFGCDITKFQDDQYVPGSIRCFLELHIEQGPVLDKTAKPIGIVSGIAGPLLLSLGVCLLRGFSPGLRSVVPDDFENCGVRPQQAPRRSGRGLLGPLQQNLPTYGRFFCDTKNFTILLK